MSKRILLINPPIHDFSAFDLWMKPLGLLYVGAMLEAQGCQVTLVDAMDRHHPSVQQRTKQKRLFGCGEFYSQVIEKPAILAHVPRRFKRFGLPQEVLREELRRQTRPDLIAVTSGMTYWYPGVMEAIALAKEVFPGVPVVLGGIYATLCPEHARKHSGADVVLTGPVEQHLFEMLSMPATRTWQELRPAYHLYSSLDSVSILTSRGCPFRCSYCASRLLTFGFTQREPAQVADEIESYVHTRGIQDIAFYDDALLIRAEEHLLEILRILQCRGVRVRFHTPNGLHIRMITKEVARALYTANFHTLRLSFETASESRQHDSDDKVCNADLQTAMENLLAAGFLRSQLEVYVMFGLPGQDVQEVARTVAFVHGRGGRIKLAQYSPIPGTPKFERAAETLPEIRTEPLLHNKTAFHHLATPFVAETYHALKAAVNKLNAAQAMGQTLERGLVFDILHT